MASPEFSLGHNRELRLARPQASASASASGEGHRLARPQASASASASGEGPRLARPQPRPRKKSPPRPTSASDRLRYRGYIITLPLASRLRLQRNKTGITSRLLRQQVMMVPCMRPSRRLFSALYEGKETSAGPRAAPPATLLQGSSTSPQATLAHSYTPICTPGPSPCIYKRGCPGPSQGTRKRLTQTAHFKAKPSPEKLVTPTTSTPVQDNISLISPLVFHLASIHLGRDTQCQIH
jgi:hypothetical protein